MDFRFSVSSVAFQLLNLHHHHRVPPSDNNFFFFIFILFYLSVLACFFRSAQLLRPLKKWKKLEETKSRTISEDFLISLFIYLHKVFVRQFVLLLLLFYVSSGELLCGGWGKIEDIKIKNIEKMRKKNLLETHKGST